MDHEWLVALANLHQSFGSDFPDMLLACLLETDSSNTSQLSDDRPHLSLHSTRNGRLCSDF
jgi:hypothetical protein